MSEKNHGGPAFPWCGDLNECPTINLGMFLRDYFAAKALPIAKNMVTGTASSVEEYTDLVSSLSYKIADSMLKARDQ